LSQSGSLPAKKLYPLDSQSNEADSSQWKQEVNQRLAAHRSRRGSAQDQSSGAATEHPRAASARASEAAARVAARYAKAPSYSQLLAGEAREAVRVASVAAEAAHSAKVAAEAVLAGLESSLEAESLKAEPRTARLWEPEERNAAAESSASRTARWQDEPPATEQSSAPAAARLNPWAGAQPRWEETLPAQSTGRDVWSEMRVHPTTEPSGGYRHELGRQRMSRSERGVLEGDLFPEESPDSFNSFDSADPMGSATVEPVQHLPANLIEFPRELVATRKARPRVAEGPFYNASHENSQLSIFEVDPDLLTTPVYPADTATERVAPPEWASIELDHAYEPHGSGVSENGHGYAEHSYVAVAEIPASYAVPSQMTATAVEDLKPAAIPMAEVREEPIAARNQATPARLTHAADLLVAPLNDRLLAAVIDGALVTLAFLAAAVVVIASTAHPPTGRAALLASGCGWLLFGLLYQFLFLSYAEEGTPGMRYARIALCTFEDDNPTVEQMRNRIPAMLLAALPAGLGMFWAIFDKDHLGWHDRMTKTYQRGY